MVTSYPTIVWLAYIVITRRSSDSRLSISVMVLHPIKRTSSGTESGSSTIYDSRRAVLFSVFSEVVLVEGPDS